MLCFIKPVMQQIRLFTGLNMGGKTRNIAIQLVLQQCCKTSCTFLLPVCRYLPESGKFLLVESGIRKKIGIRNPGFWNPEFK